MIFKYKMTDPLQLVFQIKRITDDFHHYKFAMFLIGIKYRIEVGK